MAGKKGKVLVASGPGWALYWPRDEWERLTAVEQQAVRDRQAALLEGPEGEDHRPRRPRPAAAGLINGVICVTN